jgi:hypothetical protein
MFELTTKRVFEDVLSRPKVRTNLIDAFGGLEISDKEIGDALRDKDKKKELFDKIVNVITSEEDHEEKLKTVYGDFELFSNTSLEHEFVSKTFVVPLEKWDNWVNGFFSTRRNVRNQITFINYDTNEVYASYTYYTS